MEVVITKKVDNALLDEFDKFLKRNYSENENTRKTIIYAVRKIIGANTSPDDLSVSTRSKTVYRRAWRLWNDFLDYKNANPREVLSAVRRSGIISEGKLKRLLKNKDNFNMVMLKAVESGKVYVVHDEVRRLVWVGD